MTIGDRSMRARLDRTGRALTRALAGAQGVAGVGCLTGGAYVLAGVGWALVVLGAFLVIGAWGQR